MGSVQKQWRNQNSSTKYPFTSTSRLIDVTGSLSLEVFDLIDALIYPKTHLLFGAYLSKVLVEEAQVVGTITAIDDLQDIGEFTAPRSSLSGGATKILDGDGTQRGLVVLGSNQEIAFENTALGEWSFSPESTKFEGSLVMNFTDSAGVGSISLNGTELCGRVKLVAGDGVDFVTDNSGDETTLKIHATGRQVLGDCNEGTPIKKINTTSPNEFGGILIRESIYGSPADEEDLRQIIRVKSRTGEIELSASS